jgi:polar amino acid transport system substrate-binding protein
MRSGRLILASFLLPLFALMSCPPVLAAETSLRLATLEYPPYIFATEQGAQGLTVDIVKTAFARMGQSIIIEFYPITRGQHRLLNGEADAFFSIKKTPEREQSMLFPQKPLMSQEYVFFVRKGSPWRFNGNFSSVAEARIGVVGATSYGNRFDSARQTNTFTRLDTATSHETNLRKLLAGRLDMVICSRRVGLYYLERLKALKEVEISGQVVETTFSYLVFTRKQDYTALARQFDQTLDSMERDGTLRHLSNADPALPLLPAPVTKPPSMTPR